MKLRSEKVKLTEKDKLVLLKHLNTCTDVGGYGCNIIKSKEANLKINAGLN